MRYTVIKYSKPINTKIYKELIILWKIIDIANGIIFQRLFLNADTTDAKVIAQKKIYLLQSLGTDLGFNYIWYTKGPYSPVLAEYIQENMKMLININFNEYAIHGEVLNNLEKVNNLRLNNDIPAFSDADWYELLTSLLYVYKERLYWKLSNNNSVFKKLIILKPRYKISHCNSAYKTLYSNGFIKIRSKKI